MRAMDILAPLGMVGLLLISLSSNAEIDKEKTKAPDLVAKHFGLDTHTKHAHSKVQAETARAIGRDVVCLCGTCPKRTITSCECGWAIQNQNTLINAVVAGHSPETIVSAYRAAYGDRVLSLLPNEGFATAAWALPYTVAAIALLAVFFIGFGFMKKPSAITATTIISEAHEENIPQIINDEEARKALQEELEDLD
jgi:cytochrome c-type biogenesis protein CcmH/NrfF